MFIKSHEHNEIFVDIGYLNTEVVAKDVDADATTVGIEDMHDLCDLRIQLRAVHKTTNRYVIPHADRPPVAHDLCVISSVRLDTRGGLGVWWYGGSIRMTAPPRGSRLHYLKEIRPYVTPWRM